MNPSDANDLEHRVSSLETALSGAVGELRTLQARDRRRRALFMATILVTACIAATSPSSSAPTGEAGAQGPVTVTAPFKVVNQSGEVILAVNEKETDFFSNSIALMDRDGNGKIALVPKGGGTGEAYLALYGQQSTPSLILGDEYGYGTISAFDSSGNNYLRMGKSPKQQIFTGGTLELYASGGGNSIAAIGNASDTGLIVAKKANELSWAALGTDEQGNPAVRIRKNDKLVAQLGFNATGKTALKIYGAQDTPVAAFGENPDGPGGILQINDGAGSRAAEVRNSGEGGQLAVFPHSTTAFGSLSATKNGGQVAVSNGSGQAVSILDTSLSQGGRLILADPSGGPAVRTGWNGSGGEICAATAKRGTQCIDISVPLQMR